MALVAKTTSSSFSPSSSHRYRRFPRLLLLASLHQISAMTTLHSVRETGILSDGIAYRDHFFRLPLKWRQLQGQHSPSPAHAPAPAPAPAPAATSEGLGGEEDENFIHVHVKELFLAKDLAEMTAADKKRGEGSGSAGSAGSGSSKPAILYLQGGPGYPSPRIRGTGGWVGKALQSFRVFLLDQRGTGRSTPVTSAFLQNSERFPNPEAQADYLACFRADSIVEDCEAIRRHLLGDDSKLTVLGQSYGGFCLLTYLSRHPESIQRALFTGGLAPLQGTADGVYKHTWHRCAERNRRYYAKFPGDVEKVKRIMRVLMEQRVEMPCGGVLTPERFLQLGLILGGKNGFETLHYLVESAFDGGAHESSLGYSFLRQVEDLQSYDTNPIYALLHEPIYCQNTASRWAADRTMREDPTVWSKFDFSSSMAEGSDHPVYFTGEFIFKFMFEGSYPELQPLKSCAHLLAERVWPPLYDVEALANSRLPPSAAAVYLEDMYVEYSLSQETARVLECAVWATNEFQHSGLRDDGATIFQRLMGMADGEIDIPS